MKIQSILQELTLAQKCALLSGAETFKTRALPQFGIPAIRLADGPNGVRRQAGEADHLGLNPSEPATCFPTASCLANSWDPALAQAVGRAIGAEAAAQDVAVLLGPGLNIKRSPLGGRNFEYFSEDPYLSGKLAAGYIRGVQQNGVAACPKHFAVNSQETRRMTSDSILDERTLREIYLTGFEIAVKEGAPQTIMSAYNLVNGEYANENAHLLKEVLREDWGFTGAVVTDWGGSNDHALGVKNGSALEMPAPGGDAVRELLAAVREGKLTEADIDERLGELLPLVFETTRALQSAPKTVDSAAHHALARRAAAESLVLLKNEGGLLPLAPGTRVALIGDFAKTPRYQGGGSSAVNITRLDTLLSLVEESGLQSAGYAQGFARGGRPDAALAAEAAALAKDADAAIVCLGLDETQESEGLDRRKLTLPQNQLELLRAVAQANPRVAVVLYSGGVVETVPWLGECRALLYAGLAGQAGAGAVWDVLTGKKTPEGKLAETWPLCLADTPTAGRFPAKGRACEYREGIFVGYRYYQTAKKPVAFPFGFGLSYTTFCYRGLTADKNGAEVTVQNTGPVAGAEVVQLYVSGPGAMLPRPRQELKAFAKVTLAPGESKTVFLPLDDKAFRCWNSRTGRWETESGRYELRVGASCEDIRLKTAVTIEGAAAPDPYAGLSLPHYRAADVQALPDGEFAALLGRPIPTVTTGIDRNLTLGELRLGRSPLGWLVGAVLEKLVQKSLQNGKPDLNLLFDYNMPLRALAKMTGGLVSMGMVDGLVMELKGFWLVGILRVVWEFLKNSAQNAVLEKRLAQKGRSDAGENV